MHPKGFLVSEKDEQQLKQPTYAKKSNKEQKV